jgi:hypothetical protein
LSDGWGRLGWSAVALHLPTMRKPRRDRLHGRLP